MDILAPKGAEECQSEGELGPKVGEISVDVHRADATEPSPGSLRNPGLGTAPCVGARAKSDD